MGWSTELFCNITFNKKTYNSLGSVESDLGNVEDMIKYNESLLRDLALITEPKKMLNLDEDEDVLSKIRIMLNEAFEELHDLYIEKYKLELLIDCWSNCHNKDGLAIDPPENISWDSAFLKGDFVNSVKYPNQNQI